MRFAPAAAALATVGVLLAGCQAAPSAAPTPARPAATAASTAPDTAAFLARHGLSGLSTEQVIAKLEASDDDRTAGPMGSVRPDELQLSDSTGKVSLPVPDGRFYLSVAPYVTRTHECFNHSLATCRGELANKPVAITITDAAGKQVFAQTVTTSSNGFAGLWLPRGLTGLTITATVDGKSGTQTIGTGLGDATCLTTLRLS